MNRSITSFENLSNELFYEIFDYLDGIHLHQAFSNLNQHFQRLITAPFLLLKIDAYRSFRKDQFFKNWKQIIESHRHQIYSLRLDESLQGEQLFPSLSSLDSSFNHLQSFNIWSCDHLTLLSLLSKLNCLPCLHSLIIFTENPSTNLTDIYRLVLNFPVLKYYRFYISELDVPVALPMALDDQRSQIENLNIDHCCHIDELVSILSYTPKLRRLRFSDDSGEKYSGEILSPITLSHLRSVSIRSYSLSFDQWESFIRQIRPPLQTLHFVTRSEDINYLNAHRWERFIQENLPQLESFSFYYYEYVDKAHNLPTYSFESNQFLSTFWIERKWFLNIEMTNDRIVYLVTPYK